HQRPTLASAFGSRPQRTQQSNQTPSLSIASAAMPTRLRHPSPSCRLPSVTNVTRAVAEKSHVPSARKPLSRAEPSGRSRYLGGGDTETEIAFFDQTTIIGAHAERELALDHVLTRSTENHFSRDHHFVFFNLRVVFADHFLLR